MKKPIEETKVVNEYVHKLLRKMQKENCPSLHKLQPLEALELARAAAQQQQLRVTQLIQ